MGDRQGTDVPDRPLQVGTIPTSVDTIGIVPLKIERPGKGGDMHTPQCLLRFLDMKDKTRYIYYFSPTDLAPARSVP